MPRTLITPSRTLTGVVGSGLLNQLMAHWRLSDLTDAHGANTLTNNNGATFVAGKLGNAVQLVAASSQYLSIADNAALSIGSDAPFTVGVWVYLTTKSAVMGIVTKYGASNPREFRLQYDYASDRFQFTVYNGGAFPTVVASNFGSPALATWYFILCWYDGATAYISVNNGTPDSVAAGSGASDSVHPLMIGRTSANYWNGLLDSAFVTKRVYSAAERSYLYNNNNGVDYPFVPRFPLLQARGALVQARVVVP